MAIHSNYPKPEIPEFDVEHQYQCYLHRVGLSESTMHEIQRSETRRAFFGAWAILLGVIHENLTEMDTDDAVDALIIMKEQVEYFWTQEAQNRKSK